MSDDMKMYFESANILRRSFSPSNNANGHHKRHRWEKDTQPCDVLKKWRFSTTPIHVQIECCAVKWCAFDTKWSYPNTRLVAEKSTTHQNWIRMNNELNPHAHFLRRPNCDCSASSLCRFSATITLESVCKMVATELSISFEMRMCTRAKKQIHFNHPCHMHYFHLRSGAILSLAHNQSASESDRKKVNGWHDVNIFRHNRCLSEFGIRSSFKWAHASPMTN